MLSDVGSDFVFEADDAVYISGSGEAVRRLWETLGPVSLAAKGLAWIGVVRYLGLRCRSSCVGWAGSP